ncbi:Avirulence (Avh) protein [Phytophthora megakarya]|uniref:Avirulence (Avh) protein n=1 Tax=Phytophthora megakarya TaxID=4795 RepID=A0A225WEW0_9STRA|nr:Avirulence (Avh) protein [Phytophthora megakarya]
MNIRAHFGTCFVLRLSMYLLNLISVAFIASTGLVEAETPKELQSDSPKIELQLENDIGLPGSKVLRSTSAGRIGVTEERAGGLSVPPLEKIKSVLTSSKISTEKLESWLQSKKSADIVFTRLHLDKRENPFRNPQFSTWIKYADDLSAKVPEMSAISTLTRQYGDDRLFRMIKVAKTKTDTRSVATKLETEQMQHWVTTRKDPDEVFELFKLNFVRENIFEKPEFTTWVKYVGDLNTKHPEQSSRISTQMTGSAKNKAIATKVENDWLLSGLQNRKTPEKAFLDLGLGKTSDSFLESPLLNTWTKYIEAFNTRYPKEKMTMIETLTKYFGDIDVTTMLHTEISTTTIYLATKLRSAQRQMWLDRGKSTDDVFKLLQLDSHGNTYHIVDKLLLSTWVSYVNAFITKNPDKKISFFLSLEERLKERPINQILNEAKIFANLENTAINIQMNKIQYYLASNKSPITVYELLALDDIGDGILGTPLFRTWMKYVVDFNKQNPHKQVSWFDTLRRENDSKIFRMIDKAMENPSTVSIGKDVERGWLNSWLDEMVAPSVVFRWLDLATAGDNALTHPRFKTWTTYLKEFNQRYPLKQTTMIDALRENYNDLNLIDMLKRAKDDPTIAKHATSLENALLNK